MNIYQTIDVFAGGQGSGPSAPCPQCGPHSSSKLEAGDIVRLKRNVTVQTEWGDQVFKKGRAALVVNVLPKIGNADQQVSVNIGMPGAPSSKHDEVHYMKADDVEFVSKGQEEDQVGTIQPVRKGQISQQFQTNDGATVTWVKSKDEPERSEKTLKELSTDPHRLKGQFSLIDSLTGKQDRVGYSRITKVYDTSGMPAPYHQGTGATLWVNTYMQRGAIKNITIQEQNYTTHAFKTRGILSFDYKNNAKDKTQIGRAVGMLRNRYGIKTTMARLTKAKFK